MPPRSRIRRTPSAALLRTGYQPTALPAPPEAKGETIKVESWGANNLLPQEILRVVYDSGTAETCLERLAQFIGGKGFADDAVGLAMANPQQNFNQVLAEAKHYAALGLGVAYGLRFPYSGEIAHAEVYVVETDCLRREKNGSRYVLNLELAKGKMPAPDNRVYLAYDPQATAEEIAAEVLAAASSEAGYWGHLWHVFEKRPGRGLYPVPHYWAGKEDLESDAEVPRYDRKQIKNGFFPDAIMTAVGQKYADEDDIDWQPGPGETEDHRPVVKSGDRIHLENTLKNLKGAETEASVLLLTVDSKEEIPDLKFIDKGPNSKGLTDMTNRIEGKVYRRMGVPPSLCGVAEAGLLGSNQQIVNTIKLFNLVVGPRRALCTDPLAHLFPARDFSVAPLNPVDYIDPAVVGKMTDDELRNLQGLPPLEKPQPSQSQQTLQILSTVSPLLANELIKSLTEDERRALLALPSLTAPVPTPKPAAQ